jgi:L-alanine-DL-glutamate epimerase-like enolase superfamily enzyme
LKITDIEVVAFMTRTDRYENGEPIPKKEIVQTVTKIVCDDGAEGYCLGGQYHGEHDGLDEVNRSHVTNRIKPMLLGFDPLDREKFWHWMWAAKIPEHALSAVDVALWDLAARVAGVPLYKLLGGCRDRVVAYASTYPNMGQPRDYADHALECKELGYRAYKIHPYYYWDPATRHAVPGRPSHVEKDIEVCRLVREAVGDDMVLMYDPWGTYHNLSDALLVGRELEKLGFYWYEHPMPEYRVETYVTLARELKIPICSPEIIEGSLYSRADWLRREASDISRIDTIRGGITGAMKMAAICEAYGVRCELHMSGLANLQVLGATSEDVCEYYERGLLAPGVDYDAIPPYLKEATDPLDSNGMVALPQGPGLGHRINWDYIKDNRLPADRSRAGH